MSGSVASRATRVLRDPWTLVAAGIGAGSAWAIGLPMGAAGLIGAGMFGVAAAVGRATRENNDSQSSEPVMPPLRSGTEQAELVATLQGYRAGLAELRRAGLPPAIEVTALRATEAASGAASVGTRVAHAVDAIDNAVTRAERVARQIPRSPQVRATVQRMRQRRTGLLAKHADAVNEIGGVYAKLLELSATTTDLVDLPTNQPSPAAQVNHSPTSSATCSPNLKWSPTPPARAGFADRPTRERRRPIGRCQSAGVVPYDPLAALLTGDQGRRRRVAPGSMIPRTKDGLQTDSAMRGKVGSTSLAVYNYMFPRHSHDHRPGPATGETAVLPLVEGPCPSCTALIDQLDAAEPHIAPHANLVVVAKTPIKRLATFGRDWEEQLEYH